MTKQLSQSQKVKYLPILLERDDGFKCFYCKKSLELPKFVFDHLNNDRLDNRIENFVIACQSCNVKKATDGDLQETALQKLAENEDGFFVREKNLEIFKDDLLNRREASKEIDINIVNSNITEKFITDTIESKGSILYKEALNSCTYLCKKAAGHGSQQSVRNYISSLVSMVAPFEIIRDNNNKKIIVKKNQN